MPTITITTVFVLNVIDKTMMISDTKWWPCNSEVYPEFCVCADSHMDLFSTTSQFVKKRSHDAQVHIQESPALH